MAKIKQRLVLLDTHAILHRAYHALPDFQSPSGEPTGALYGVVAMLLRIIEEFKPDYIVACFDLPEPTYRHNVFEDYKAKREKTDDTLVAQIIRSRDILADFGIPIYEHSGFEADDLLGTIAFQTKEMKDLEVIIASGDMDTMQCVDGKRVQVYTLKRSLKDTVLYDEKAVKDRFGFLPKQIPDYKGLRGDTSDNIPGIRGIGEKTATDLIIKFGSIDNLYKKIKKDENLFLEAGIKPRIVKLLKEGEEEAQFSKMLATIRLDVPVEFSLPDKVWPEGIDIEKTASLFSELGFRTLMGRLKLVLGLSSETLEVASVQDITKEEIEEVGILLWLLESERTNPRLSDITDYGRAQFETTNFYEIRDRLRAEVVAAGSLEKVFNDIEQPLRKVLAVVNQTGLKLDTVYLEKLSKKMHQELQELEAKVFAESGEEFNLNSPKQLGEVLFEKMALKPKNQKRTAGGQLSTRESELEKLKDTHPIIPLILRYRELQKLVSTYVDALPKGVGEDGRIKTTFIQTGSATGRMASKDPNLQNIPVRTEESRAIRRAFVATEGFSFVSIDYSQIELRIAAVMSKDKKMIEIFKNGEDVHEGVAARVFGVSPAEVTSEMRRQAKVINFGILYGMGVNALRTNLGEGTSREAAQSFLNAYFNTFTRLAEYLEETKDYARKFGFTETLFGRRRYFPGIASSAPFIRAQAERMAINAPIQGTAADIVRLAMIKVYQYLEEETLLADVKILLQVHDELVFEIKEEQVEKVTPKLIEIMENILPKELAEGVPLKVSVAVGPNWADLVDRNF